MALTCPGGQVLGVALLQGAHRIEGGLGPAHQVVCQRGRVRGEAWAEAPAPSPPLSGCGVGTEGGQEGGPTRGAGAAQVQGVVQLAHRVLQDAFGLRGGSPEHRELLVQQPLLQPLLLRLLAGEGDRGAAETQPGAPLRPLLGRGLWREALLQPSVPGRLLPEQGSQLSAKKGSRPHAAVTRGGSPATVSHLVGQPPLQLVPLPGAALPLLAQHLLLLPSQALGRQQVGLALPHDTAQLVPLCAQHVQPGAQLRPALWTPSV